MEEIGCIIGDYKADFGTSKDSLLIMNVNIKAQYKRASGQLHIITENGKRVESNIESNHLYPNDRTFEMLAKSFYWNKQIKNGIYKTPTEISRIENQNIEYAKRAIRQCFLSPKIVKRITSNSENIQIPLEKLVQCQHWNWQKQEEFILKSA